MDYTKLSENVSKLGLVTILLLAIFAGFQGYWVFGTTYQAAIADRDQWKTMALKALHVGEAANSRFVGSASLPPAASGPDDETPEAVRYRIRDLEAKTKGL